MTAAEKAIATRDAQGEVMEQVVVQGDLKALTPAQRVVYYNRVCESLGLNPLTKPFEYITLNGKLTLYAKKDCTDQLRSAQGVSVSITSRERLEDVYLVTARATKDGRTDESVGAVAIASLKGESLANALMKAETKAKRRVTLSLCGLGWLDETEIETIPDAKATQVDMETGEVQDAPAALPGPNGQDAAKAVLCRELFAAAKARQMSKPALNTYLEPFGATCEPASLREQSIASLQAMVDGLKAEPGADEAFPEDLNESGAA